MKKLLVLLWTLSTAPPSHAGSLQPLHQGYAFDRPRVLAQQRLFGLAHGVTLLAASCARDPGYRNALISAYAQWNEREAAAIEISRQDLARYYFGDRFAEASWADVSHALGLKDRLSLKSGSKELRDACDTFVAALKKPRFELGNQYRLLRFATRLDAATAIEAETEACRSRLPEAEAARLDSALDLWRRAHSRGVEEARTELEQHWSDSLLGGTLDEALAQARERGKRSGRGQHCDTLHARLGTRQYDPDDAFDD